MKILDAQIENVEVIEGDIGLKELSVLFVFPNSTAVEIEIIAF
jgi:hypothetical protein